VNYVKLLLAIASVLMLSTLAVAVPESSQLGPFVVSFDMNTNLQHQLRVMPAFETPTATIYGMEIFTDNNTKAVLAINQYNGPTDSTLGLYKQLSAMDVALNFFNVTNVVDRTIDGMEGYLLTSVPIEQNTRVPAGTMLYRASYWLDSTKCPCGPVSVGTTSVDLTSSYPQDATENLLNSLHVVKGEATAAAATVPAAAPAAAAPMSQDMPPAQNTY
jgi:hypothetical protein